MKRQLDVAGLLLLGVGLAVVILEIGVVALMGEQPKFPRHVVGADFGVRINQPGARYRHKSADVEVQFRINGQGMRADRDYPYAKPPGTLRIVSLGDSFTIGYEVDVSECFSSVLDRELGDRGWKVEVLNAGVSGYSNAEAYVYLERELLKYDPDLVLLSFYGNDLLDNVRSGLFGFEGGSLVPSALSYVPAGRLGDLLNRNPLMNLLSERSNAFVAFKERATLMAKRGMAKRGVALLERSDGPLGSGPATQATARSDAEDYPNRLTAAILERLYELSRRHDLPLVIQVIPNYRIGQRGLADLFPYDLFPAPRPGLEVMPMKPLLEPELERQPLYHLRSHLHWTPASHAISGRALADRILARGFLH